MPRHLARTLPWLASIALLLVSPTYTLAIEFEDHLRAREAIEKVYHSYRLDTTRPFEQTVTSQMLENRVRDYLKKSVALEQVWHTPVTAEMLQRELERIAARTQFPERLEAIARALGNDPVLLAECLARPALVERLTRRFFDGDDEAYDAWWLEQAPSFEVSGALGESGPHVMPLIGGGASSETSMDLGSPECDPSDRWDNGILQPALLMDRPGYAAVWTGSEMIVWGGGPRATSSGYDTGMRYDPLLDDWHPTATSGAPSARVDHHAVWTGSEMIVWGGQLNNITSLAKLNSGGRYDPVLDAWTPMSSVNAPSGRLSAVAVWTDSGMIVWGGYSTSGGWRRSAL